ncbi:MAG: hypothetical protein AB8U44_00770 [Aaplasma endosymbiont of Hyalomma asiaticum]
MKKKIAYWVMNTSIALVVVLLALKVASVLIVTNSTDRDNKYYSLNISDSGSLGYRVGAIILRPIIESRIDSYIREQGLWEYLENLKLQMPPKSSFSYSDVQEGTGPKVLCGQKVTAHIVSTQTGGTEKSTTDNLNDKIASIVNGGGLLPISFQVGTHDVSEVNYGLLGMQKDTSRIIVVDSEKFSGSHYVNLISIDSSGPSEEVMNRFMVFDRTKPKENKAVSVFRCGDEVSIMYNVRDASGNILISRKAETFKIGARTVPAALDLAAVDLRSDSMRSVIVPPELMHDFDNIPGDANIKIIDVWCEVQEKSGKTS